MIDILAVLYCIIYNILHFFFFVLKIYSIRESNSLRNVNVSVNVQSANDIEVVGK